MPAVVLSSNGVNGALTAAGFLCIPVPMTTTEYPSWYDHDDVDDPPAFTPEQISDARDWCADVFPDYLPSETDGYVLRVVELYYDGGLAGFLADGGYDR